MNRTWLFHEEDLKNEPKLFSFVRDQAKYHLVASFHSGFHVSEHCVAAMKHDLADGHISRLYSPVDFIAFLKHAYGSGTCELVEAELSEREADGKYVVTKAVIRMNGLNLNGNNPVVAIRYNYDRFACIDFTNVATFWTNSCKDCHGTLDLSKYSRDVHGVAKVL